MEYSAQNNAALLRTRLRTRLSALRQQLPDADRRRGALRVRARLYTWLGLRRDAAADRGQSPPHVIAAYWPLADEIDLRPLLTQWAEAGLTVALPAIAQRHTALTFRPWTPDTPMHIGAYGIAEPQGHESVTPDVLLVPTLGYTDHADRLGYGGGYYDRTLAALHKQGHTHTAIGIAWSCARIRHEDAYQPALHDMRLDAVLTPDGWTPDAP